MAGAIRGITVEIGGDTTKLGKALANVEKKSKDLQSELKGVNTLLKMDPGNVTLLTQKQEILKESIAATSEKLETLKKASKDAAKTAKNYDAWKAKIEPIRAEIDNTTDQLKKMKKAAEDAAKDFGLDSEEYAEAAKAVAGVEDVLKDLRKQAKAVNDEFGNPISPEQYRDLQREIVLTEQNLKSLKDQFKDFGSVAAQQISVAGQKFTELGDKISGAGEKLLPVTGAVAAAGTAVVMSADDLKSAANSYLTATGTAAEGTETLADGTVVVTDNMETFKGVIEDIYANNYGESFEDIANSMSKVKNNMGEIDGTQLQAATESALALRDVFEFDVNESTRTAKMLMDQYGMSADDAFNLIAQGAQNGLDKNGDLLDTINEYAVHFEGLGLDAEEMFNMLSNGADNGTFSVDKLGDAVKEFGIRVKDGTADDAFKALGFSVKGTTKAFAEGGEGAKKAFKDVTDALFAMEDPVKQNALGVQLFGTMWEDLGVEGVKALTNMNGEISTTNAAMDELKAQKYDDLKSQLSELGRNFVTNVAVPLGETLLPIISSVVEKLSEWVAKFGELSPAAQTVILVVSGIAAAIGPILIVIGKVLSAVGTIMTWVPKIVSGAKLIGTGLKALFGLIAAHPVIAIVTAVIAAVVLLYNKCEWFRNGVNAIVKAVINFFKNLGPSLVNIFNKVRSNLSTWWTNLSTNFKTWTTNVITSTVNFFKQLPGKIYNAIVGAINRVKTWGSNLLNTARTAASNMVSNVVSFVSQLPGKIYNAIQGAISRVRSWGSSIASAAGSAIKTMVSNVVSIASGLPGKFLSIGRNIIEGIKNGISGALGGLYSSIKSGLSGLVDKAKSALGIRSPSRVFRDTIGAMIPSGIAVGIQKNEDIATDAVEDMANDLAAQEFSVNGATINRKLNTTFGQESATKTAANTLNPANLMSMLGEIRDKLSRLQVVLDSGELVGGIIDPIDTALNDKYTRVARGW